MVLQFTLRLMRSSKLAMLTSSCFIVTFVGLQVLMLSWDETISTPTALPIVTKRSFVTLSSPKVDNTVDDEHRLEPIRNNSTIPPGESDGEIHDTESEVHDPVSLFLVRNIGNALPPRHTANQTIENLNFTLRNEPKHPNTTRHWFLNRLADPLLEQQIIDLLHHYKETFTVIPLDLSLYEKIPYHFERQTDFPQVYPNTIYEGVHHEKTVFAININGVRNSMLRYGKKRTAAEYILPWDGNSYVTKKAWVSIQKGIKQNRKDRYLFVAMHRAKSNAEVLMPDYEPHGEDEPQIIFHRDSLATFNPYLRYGSNNKVELLKKLRGVKMEWNSEWEERYASLHETDISDHIREADNVVRIQWVSRLFSGQLAGELSPQERSYNRDEGVYRLLRNLDSRAVREVRKLNWWTLLVYNAPTLHHAGLSLSDENTEPKPEVKAVLTMADAVMRKDHIANPMATPANPEWPVSMQDNVITLTLAYKVTLNTTYAKTAVKELDSYFVDQEKSQMHKFGQFSQNNMIAMMKGLPIFLDAVKILSVDDFVSTGLSRSLRRWFMYRGWGEMFTKATDYRGVLFDLHCAAMSAYKENFGSTTALLFRAMERMDRHVDNAGRIALSEESSPPCERDQLYTMQSFVLLARAVRPFLGYDLFSQDYSDTRDNIRSQFFSSTKLCLALKVGNPLYKSQNFCVGDADSNHDFKRAWEDIEAIAQTHCPNMEPRRPVTTSSSWIGNVLQDLFSMNEEETATDRLLLLSL